MKNLIKLCLPAFVLFVILTGCNSNNSSMEANTSDSVLMDSPMTTGTGSDTLKNPGGTGVDNTRNPAPPQQTPLQ